MKRFILIISVCAIVLSFMAPVASAATMSTKMLYQSNSGSTAKMYIYLGGIWAWHSTKTLSWDEYRKANYALFYNCTAGQKYKWYITYRDGHKRWYGPITWSGSTVTLPSY